MKRSKVSKYSDIDMYSYTNKYLMLLQRLDEEEGVCEPSIEEKLKLAVCKVNFTRGFIIKKFLTDVLLDRRGVWCFYYY